MSTFFIASPTTPEPSIDAALTDGQNLILTPGVYELDQPIHVTKPNTIVLGLGLATLVPRNGTAAIVVADASGVKLSGFIVDAGPKNSDPLVQLGSQPMQSTNPPLMADVFFRIGGATIGSATTSLVVNSADTILDDVWAWRADHGADVSWTTNRADTGLVVNGDDVTAYGLFVEHYQQTQVKWNGTGGRDYFFQSELPYDPPTKPPGCKTAPPTAIRRSPSAPPSPRSPATASASIPTSIEVCRSRPASRSSRRTAPA